MSANNKSIEEMNIYEKVLNIQNELAVVGKNLEVGEGKYSYKAVGEADILEAVKPMEYKYHVLSFPFDRNIVETATLVNVKKYKDVEEEKKQLFMRLETVYRFLNIDKPQEFIDVKTYGDGVDSQDKATGKAMTYADKYALMKMYKIQTGEDPDKEPSGDLKTVDNKTINKPKQNLIDEQTLKVLASLLTDDDIKVTKEYYHIKDLNELYQDVAVKMIAKKTGNNNE